MKVLLDATTEVGRRAGSVLLAEDDLEWIGLWDAANAGTHRRSGPETDPAGYSVAVTDRDAVSRDFIARCSVVGVPVVSWHDADHVASGGAAIPVVTGANVGSALTAVLEHHPAARRTANDTIQRAWTEPGKPLRRGATVVFPDPIGLVHTKRRSRSDHVAYRDDEWAGAVLRLESGEDIRVIGVADHGAHLEALVLAATALCATDGAYAPGSSRAADAGEQLLNRLESVELGLAVWRSNT